MMSRGRNAGKLRNEHFQRTPSYGSRQDPQDPLSLRDSLPSRLHFVRQGVFAHRFSTAQIKYL